MNVIFTVVTALSMATGTAKAIERRAAAPFVLDGGFEKSTLKPYWHTSNLHAPITLATYPSGSSNQAMRFANINCENEAYADASGTMKNMLPQKQYNLTYRFLYEDNTSNVDWSTLFYIPSQFCDPCLVVLPKHVQYPTTVTGGTWYIWKGTFTAAKNVTRSHGAFVVDISPQTCGYSGAIYVDSFSLSEL